MNTKENKTSQIEPGFTLVETIVAIFIFGIIFSIVGLIFGQAIFLQRRAVNAQVVEENLNLILESMAREIRVSQVSGPNTSCPSVPSGTLNLIHPVNGNVAYFLSNNDVHRTVNGVDSTVSSNTVQFTRLQFCVTGTFPGNQPRITIIGSLQSTNANNRIQEDFQTTLSQRLLNPN